MIFNLFEKNMGKILAFLLISPGSRYKRKDLKEKTNMNNVPLDEALASLLKLKIIKEENNLYSLNFENEDISMILNILKKEYLYFNVPYKIFYILIELSEKLKKISSLHKAVLFGSYVKLIYHDKSDIDIAIILQDSEEKRIKIEKKLEKDIVKISKKNGKKIETHFFKEKDMKNASDILIKDILRNGKELL